MFGKLRIVLGVAGSGPFPAGKSAAAPALAPDQFEHNELIQAATNAVTPPIESGIHFSTPFESRQPPKIGSPLIMGFGHDRPEVTSRRSPLLR